MLEYIGLVIRGSLCFEVFFATLTRKGIDRRRHTFFIAAWALIQNDDISKDNKLSLLMRRVKSRRLWRNSVEDLLSMKVILDSEDGRT